MLEIENYSVTFKKEMFLSADNLALESGRKFNLLGRNGSGKSIFLKSIHGTFTAYKGSIKIKERTPLFYKKRKKTIFIESIPRILPEETVWRNITLPFHKITIRQKQKITDLCNNVGLSELIGLKAKLISFSAAKFIELIRAAVQLPHILLLDDMDTYFDEINLVKALDVCEYALNNGATIIATSTAKLENFDYYYRIVEKKMVKL
ncbi:MAG: ATP-binding cassette domain-containing protein [Candidatus Cloacimonetes bacterium]|nr:ATP-binding cassette domain-containing protein [Candidatus Cloacimonadota bacterium]